jgi:glyoxylase-like metal-dependent hydrolase (beta-lactamase superfamily II)
VPLEPIDLHHQGFERVIGVYLLDTDEGPALFDCGPARCVDALKEGLAARRLELGDVCHILLSHIHLDHAGAAGVLVREHPTLQVHVSEVGAPHLIDPARLEASARRLYGDAFDTLWGELAPVPTENVHVVGDRVLGLECFPTPGHASHHVCYLDGVGTLYAGDAAGVRIQPRPFVLAPTPPPEVDIEAWERSLDEVERRRPERLALIHFGVAEDVVRHLGDLRAQLVAAAAAVERGIGEAEFVASICNELGAEDAADCQAYERAMPFEQSYAGLKRYWEKRDSS